MMQKICISKCHLQNNGGHMTKDCWKTGWDELPQQQMTHHSLIGEHRAHQEE